MTVRLVGLWTEPTDIDAFERDYLGSHFPLVDTLPASKGVRTSRCIDGPYFRMTEVSFTSIDDMHAALATEAGEKLTAAARGLADKYGIRLDVLVVAEAT